MGNQVQSIASVFDGWCKCIDQTSEFYIEECMKTYGFLLRVVVSKDIPPRHSMFSWIRGMGVTKFDEIFQGKVHFPSDWLIAFPERHISIDEQQKLIHQICKVNDKNKRPLKKLDILTQSAFIMSDTKADCMSIIGFKGKPTYDQDYML